MRVFVFIFIYTFSTIWPIILRPLNQIKNMENKSYDKKFMQRAIELSEQGYVSGKGLPIGCVIVKNGQIVGEGHNEIFVRKNPTAHAEMVAIEEACKNLSDLQLSECEMYTTLEPCPMCFSAIYWAKLKTVFFANTKKEGSDVGFDDSFIFEQMQKPANMQMISMHHYKEEAALNILKDWKAKDLNAAQPWKHTIDK